MQVTSADTVGVEADIDVLDEHGKVLLTVQGLRLGTGLSENARRDRVLNERLLAIDWQQRELPEVRDTDGAWLLISTSASADATATKLTDALHSAGAVCTTMEWPQNADHKANAEELVSQLNSGGFRGVVVLTAPQNGNPEKESALRGGEYVHHLVRIARELPDIAGEPARLYVLTRNAQSVVHGDLANLEQVGLRGLMRVIGTEHPHLHATQIDLDDKTDAGQVAEQLLGGSDEDETAWRNGDWYTARLRPTPLRPEERRTTVIDHKGDGMRLQIRTPGDLESMELVAFDRVPPSRGEIQVAITASSINFADVLVAFGRYPSFEGHLPKLGTDFAGVVTAVGPDVTELHVGDHVGGMSPAGCWATFVNCDATAAVKLPAGLTDQAAAAVTTASATAWYGLHNLARTSSRDKVLIHSATGGVGQAKSVETCCVSGALSMSTPRAVSTSPTRSARIPAATGSTSCSTPSPVPRNGRVSNCWPSADASSKSASATSTAILAWGCSPSAGTCRSTPWTSGCSPSPTPRTSVGCSTRCTN